MPLPPVPVTVAFGAMTILPPADVAVMPVPLELETSLVPEIVTFCGAFDIARMPPDLPVTDPVPSTLITPFETISTPRPTVEAMDPFPVVVIEPLSARARMPVWNELIPPPLLIVVAPFTAVVVMPTPAVEVTLPTVVMLMVPRLSTIAVMPSPTVVTVDAGVITILPPAFDCAKIPSALEETGPVPITLMLPPDVVA